MTTDILKLIEHLAALAEGIAQFDDTVVIYWQEAGQIDDNEAINNNMEAYDNINKRMVMTQEAMGKVLRQYGQRSEEHSRILRAEDEFNNNKTREQ